MTKTEYIKSYMKEYEIKCNCFWGNKNHEETCNVISAYYRAESEWEDFKYQRNNLIS